MIHSKIKMMDNFLNYLNESVENRLPDVKVGDIMVRQHEGRGANMFYTFFQVIRRTATQLEVRELKTRNKGEFKEPANILKLVLPKTPQFKDEMSFYSSSPKFELRGFWTKLTKKVEKRIDSTEYDPFAD